MSDPKPRIQTDDGWLMLNSGEISLDAGRLLRKWNGIDIAIEGHSVLLDSVTVEELILWLLATLKHRRGLDTVFVEKLAEVLK